MKISKILLAGILGLSGLAHAAPQTYNIDNGHTFPRFSYNHLGFSTQLSKFDKTTGTISYDKEAKTGSVELTIDMKSVNTGFTVFNSHIQGEDFFDTEKYPTATFKSTKVVFEGDKVSDVVGDLTIKGVTKSVTLKVNSFVAKEHPMMKKDAIGSDASVVIKRSDFNIIKYVPYVGDDITIGISLEAVKQ